MAPVEKKMFRNYQLARFHLQNGFKCADHAGVGCNAALESNGSFKVNPFCFVAFKISGHGHAQAHDDIVVRCCDLLQVDHVGFCKNAASSGDAGRVV